MSWRWRAVGAIAGLALLAGQPAIAADRAPASEARVRVAHFADYPGELAQEERDGLLRVFAKFGYVQGRNLELTTYAVGALPAASVQPDVAAKIAATQPRLVLASGVRAVSAARDSGLTTPVVFWRITDPVGNGFVRTLARPGGNLTGFSRAIEKLTAKRLELLHEMLPGARRIAFVFIQDFPSHARQAAEVRAAAAGIGLVVHEYALPSKRWNAVELDALFATMRRDGIEAFLLPDINVGGEALVELAARHRLPTIHSLTHVVTEWGGLASYSTEATSEDDVVGYAVRILRGERPADLPVQEPTRFELVLNTRAARALGLTFPSSLLLRANQVIEK